MIVSFIDRNWIATAIAFDFALFTEEALLLVDFKFFTVGKHSLTANIAVLACYLEGG